MSCHNFDYKWQVQYLVLFVVGAAPVNVKQNSREFVSAQSWSLWQIFARQNLYEPNFATFLVMCPPLIFCGMYLMIFIFVGAYLIEIDDIFCRETTSDNKIHEKKHFGPQPKTREKNTNQTTKNNTRKKRIRAPKTWEQTQFRPRKKSRRDTTPIPPSSSSSMG